MGVLKRLCGRVWGVVDGLLGSKKAAAAMAGGLVMLAGQFGFDLDADTADRIAAIVMAYCVGQGIADVGKNRVAA